MSHSRFEFLWLFLLVGIVIAAILGGAYLIDDGEHVKKRNDLPQGCTQGAPAYAFEDSSTGHTVVLYTVNC